MSSCSTNTPFKETNLPPRLAIVSFIGLAIAARRQRRALRNLDESVLRDLGLSRKDAETEANRPLWDVPANWRR